MALRLRFPSLLPMILTLLALSAFESWAVTMDVSVGFGGQIKDRAWAPVAVRLENSSADTVTGEIEVRQVSDKRLKTCGARVNLPPNSKKLYHVYVKPPQYGGDLSVALVDSGQVIVKKEVSVTLVDSGDTLVMTVGPKPSPLNFMTGVGAPPRPGATPWAGGGGRSGSYTNKIVIGAVTPDELPDRPSAYSGVDVIVLPEFNPSSASPKVLQALSMWVASGGTLIVPGGADYRRLKNGFYDELLPVTISGPANISTARLGWGSGGAAAAQYTVKRGIGHELGAKAPFAVARSYADGAVIFLAFDPLTEAFAGWGGQIKFWSALMLAHTPEVLVDSSAVNYIEDYTYQSSPYSQQMQQKTLSPVVEQNVTVKTPSFTLLAIFLFAYLIALVPVNYTVLKVKKRLELAWVTTPAIVVFFTLAAYAIGYSTKGSGLQANQITFIEGSADARYAAKITDASVFSPGRRSYDVEAADPYALCEALSSDRAPQKSPAYVEENACAIEGMDMPMWSSRTVESTSGADLGGRLEARLTRNMKQMDGEITNNTTLTLKDCKIYFQGGVTSIGTIGRGETVKVNGQRRAWVGSHYSNKLDMDASFQDALHDMGASWNVPVLIGYSDSDPVVKLRNARDSGKSITCCAFRLESNQISLATSVAGPTPVAAPSPAPGPAATAPPPPAPPIMGVAFGSSTFDSGADGWRVSAWRSATFPPATMTWSPAGGRAGGGIRCVGSGQSDNDDRSTREGGEIRKTISTVGHSGIRVYYDLRVNSLGNPYVGPGSGSTSTHVDHNLVDDQLTVYYSTDGGATWHEAERVLRAELLRYQHWGRRLVDLSSNGAVGNNPQFMLKFRWQVNGTNDTADLDNILLVTGS